ncbi:NAD(P)-dependent oxidoreductase [Streptomyces sp. NPDC005648]|uniref:NAD-dependent epimerase/dehydratase family protein n=1 Tax=Streptomyces sp. NPDC005648 TaxID=3157044 RepID=UPI0033A3A63E
MTPGELRGRRVLVLGAGLLGAAVAARAHTAGGDVVCADLDESRARTGADGAGGQWLRLDLADRAATVSAVRSVAPDVVVHAAGSVTAESAADAGRLMTGTASAAANLAEAAVSARVPRVLLLSSLAVYGAPARPPDSGPAATAETAPTRPVTPYGAAKAAAEAILSGYCAGTGTDVRIGRLSGVYGPGARPRGGWMAGGLLRLLALYLTGRPITVPPALHDREYLHVDDAATALALLAVAPRDTPQVVNIGTGRLVPAAELAEVLTALGATVVGDGDVRPGVTARRPLDVSTATRALGFTARITLYDGLAAWCARLRKEGP